MIKFVFTGPESTGKTDTALHVSQKFSFCYVPEFAVEYLNNTDGRYKFEDLYKIAKGQIETENEIVTGCNSRAAICDTDLITIKIWSAVKYKKVDNRIYSMIRNRKYDHYILCYPDIIWEYSKFRENPDDRDVLFNLYLNQLKYYKKDFSILKGIGGNRIEKAENIVRSVLKKYQL